MQVSEQSGITLLDDATQDPIVVPYAELAAELLRGVIESFVLREGTDYGEQAFSLDEKVAQVIRQLEHGEAHIVFEPTSQTVDVVVSTATKRRAKSL
jgi:uncharacterized protein YheU (UPF0270 family)